ncbi:hypothetical protein [Micromonospora sp. NPDC093277]|uniref:hypothetical protein n=1 Tax=Micromonospora sp. NPDC093277 TaxID=3364291 RepID=UPI003803BE69
MAVIPPHWAGNLKSGPPPRLPVDRRVRLQEWLFGLAAVSLVITAGILSWHLARLAAPTIVRWQITVTDANNDAPPRPELPISPFAR